MDRAEKRLGAALAAFALLLAGCPQKRVERPYPPPTAAALLAHLKARASRIASVQAEAKVDYLADKGDRVKVGMTMLAEDPDHLRIEANSPFGGAVASLATDGKQFQLLDARNNRFLTGEASPCNIARLIRVELRPADVATVLEGAAPILDGDDVKAEAGWDGRDGGREVLTLRSPRFVETIELSAKDQRWDVLRAELKKADGAIEWRLTNTDFVEVGPEQMPARTTIEQPVRGVDVRIRYKERVINLTPPATAFRIEPPAGLPVEQVSCEP